MKGFLARYWSAIKGATLDLMPPVPNPMMIMAAISPPRDAPCSMDTGKEVKKRTKSPTIYTTAKSKIVLYLPRYWSAMIAPKIGGR